MARTFAPLGWAFETVLNMTDTLTVTDSATNIVTCSSGASSKVLTLPAISQMVLSQNPVLFVVNNSTGNVTLTPNAADSATILGLGVTLANSTGVALYHNGIHQWYAIGAVS